LITNSFINNQHVKISLMTLKVSAVCTVQQCPNVIKFHEENWGLSLEKVVHQQKDEKMLFFLLLMLLFRSVCHQVSNQADNLILLAIFIVSRLFAHLFKWASSGQCFLTTYNMQLTNNKKQWAVCRAKTKNAKTDYHVMGMADSMPQKSRRSVKWKPLGDDEV